MDNFNILGQINYGKLKIYIHISVKFQMMLNIQLLTTQTKVQLPSSHRAQEFKIL